MDIATVVATSPLTVRLHGDVDEDTPVLTYSDGTPSLSVDDRVYVEMIAGAVHVIGRVVDV